MVCGRANQQLEITNNKNIPYEARLVKWFLQFLLLPLLCRSFFYNFCRAGLDKTTRFRYTCF